MWYLTFLMATQTKNSNRLAVNITIAEAAMRRLPEIQDAINGVSRLRPSRWPGQTSLYDTNRVFNLIADLANSETISKSRISSLQGEVDTFSEVLGPQLVRSLKAAKAI